MKAILFIFLGLYLPLFLVFSALAVSFKSFKIYLTGVLVSLLYFLAATEGTVYVYNQKIPLIGFLVNPFGGEYKPILLNYQYNKIYFWLVAGLTVVGAIYLKVKTSGNIPIQKSPENN